MSRTYRAKTNVMLEEMKQRMDQLETSIDRNIEVTRAEKDALENRVLSRFEVTDQRLKLLLEEIIKYRNEIRVLERKAFTESEEIKTSQYADSLKIKRILERVEKIPYKLS